MPAAHHSSAQQGPAATNSGHIRLRLQPSAAHIRRASVDPFDSNTNPVTRKTHKLDCPTAHITGIQGSSIPLSVPFLQCLRRHNERDSLRKFSHCPPRSTSRLPLCPWTPPLECCRLSDAMLAPVMGLPRSESASLMGSERSARLESPIATSRSSAVRNTISVRHLPIAVASLPEVEVVGRMDLQCPQGPQAPSRT